MQKPKFHPNLIYLLCIMAAIVLMMLVWWYFGEHIEQLNESSYKKQ
ncbi:MAG: hypothetical protein P0Y53_01050 [Candidatus Pseudobacter hemicellulosilyticus]|uniref:Uncharacterized protein n=1 Tax=Candidatus Pseudobacter hemicellulosilyticus TaxID=3121375 RepID=A0AAJ5WTW5_9BACT|nr:MAG: hypothetical protein P0Y53_01050 [Pseudobacter sp.]